MIVDIKRAKLGEREIKQIERIQASRAWGERIQASRAWGKGIQASGAWGKKSGERKFERFPVDLSAPQFSNLPVFFLCFPYFPVSLPFHH